MVYLTAYSDKATLERAKLTEPFGYLLKPVDSISLQTVVEVSSYKHQIEEWLRVSAPWLFAVLQCANDAIVAADKDGKVSLMPTSESLLGLTESQVPGKNLAGLFAIAVQQAA